MPPHAGGLELVVHNLVEGLRARGHDLRWIASSAPEAPGRSGHLVRVPAWNLLERTAHVPLPLWGPEAHRQLWNGCRWADVVHVHDCLYPSSASAIAVARLLRRPVVMTQHIARVPYGPLLDAVQALAYRTLGRALLRSVDEVAVYSPHVARHVERLGVSRPAHLISLGFDARFASPTPAARRAARAAYELPEHAKLALFVGRLVPKKGVDQLAALQRTAPRDMLLWVVGDGPLAHLVADLPRTRHVRSVPYEHMHTLFAAADLLILPSRGEGFPLAVQEALLTGLPAVVSDDPAYLTNLEGAPGVWFAPDLEALRAGVERALGAGIERATIAAWASARFRRDRFIAAYEQLYEGLCLLPRDA